jgi:hypothetical protein
VVGKRLAGKGSREEGCSVGMDSGKGSRMAGIGCA